MLSLLSSSLHLNIGQHCLPNILTYSPPPLLSPTSQRQSLARLTVLHLLTCIHAMPVSWASRCPAGSSPAPSLAALLGYGPRTVGGGFCVAFLSGLVGTGCARSGVVPRSSFPIDIARRSKARARPLSYDMSHCGFAHCGHGLCFTCHVATARRRRDRQSAFYQISVASLIYAGTLAEQVCYQLTHEWQLLL